MTTLSRSFSKRDRITLAMIVAAVVYVGITTANLWILP